MNEVTSILAASDSEPTLKIIIGLIAAGIWVIAQIASAVGKKKDKSRVPEQEIIVDVSRSDQAPPRRTQQVPHQQRPGKQRPEPNQRRQRAGQYQDQQQVRVPQPPPLQQQQQRRQMPEASRPVARLEPAVPHASPLQIGKRDRLRTLLRPKNLQKEFLLTEILQPPIALRPERDR